MRRNEKKHIRPAGRLSAPPAPLLPGRPLVEEALPGRLLVLMSQLHRRERPTVEAPRSPSVERGPGEPAWPPDHRRGETAGSA